jgi:hypothetical protein
MGKSFAFLYDTLKRAGIAKPVLYAVDTFEPECSHHEDVIKEYGRGNLYTSFKMNMQDLGIWDHIKVVKMSSVEAAKEINHNFCFVFIDAAHDYESVKSDLAAWWPKVTQGGIFAGHDYFQPHAGVKQAVDEFAEHKGLKLEFMDSCWLINKQ